MYALTIQIELAGPAGFAKRPVIAGARARAAFGWLQAKSKKSAGSIGGIPVV